MVKKKNNFTCEIRCKKHDGWNDVCKTDVMRIKTKVGDVYMVAEQWQISDNYRLCTYDTALFRYNWERILDRKFPCFDECGASGKVDALLKNSTEKNPVPGFPHMGDGGLMPDASRGFIVNLDYLEWLVQHDAEFVPILIPRSKVIEYRAAFEAFPER